jgi:hypothetical protein
MTSPVPAVNPNDSTGSAFLSKSKRKRLRKMASSQVSIPGQHSPDPQLCTRDSRNPQAPTPQSPLHQGHPKPQFHNPQSPNPQPSSNSTIPTDIKHVNKDEKSIPSVKTHLLYSRLIPKSSVGENKVKKIQVSSDQTNLTLKEFVLNYTDNKKQTNGSIKDIVVSLFLSCLL